MVNDYYDYFVDSNNIMTVFNMTIGHTFVRCQHGILNFIYLLDYSAIDVNAF